MVLQSRKEYLLSIKERYLSSSKKQKKLILDEFCAVCGYNRKYACRILNQRKQPPKKKPGRKPIYLPILLNHLKKLWLDTGQMCSKKFIAAIPIWLPFYEQEYGLLEPLIKQQLLKISSATIDRILKKVRASSQPNGLCATKPGSLLKNQIPIRTEFWDVNTPGFVEADTVALCGNSLAGAFVWALTLTDIHTTWTEIRAVWTKGAPGIVCAINDIQSHLPFRLRGFDCDNGSEFLNECLVTYFSGESNKDIAFTRSRPYKKNDNAHVEQKNYTHVRQLLGYDRYENPKLVELINDLCINAWSPYQNFFCPALKLKSKIRINSKYIKTYDNAKTPYQRILESENIPDGKKNELKAKFNSLNPFTLKKSIEHKLKIIFTMLRDTKTIS